MALYKFSHRFFIFISLKVATVQAVRRWLPIAEIQFNHILFQVGFVVNKVALEVFLRILLFPFLILISLLFSTHHHSTRCAATLTKQHINTPNVLTMKIRCSSIIQSVPFEKQPPPKYRALQHKNENGSNSLVKYIHEQKVCSFWNFTSHRNDLLLFINNVAIPTLTKKHRIRQQYKW
jgi:hypothetical protein